MYNWPQYGLNVDYLTLFYFCLASKLALNINYRKIVICLTVLGYVHCISIYLDLYFLNQLDKK